MMMVQVVTVVCVVGDVDAQVSVADIKLEENIGINGRGKRNVGVALVAMGNRMVLLGSFARNEREK